MYDKIILLPRAFNKIRKNRKKERARARVYVRKREKSRTYDKLNSKTVYGRRPEPL